LIDSEYGLNGEPKANEWQSVRIYKKMDLVTHFVNGYEVLSFNVSTLLTSPEYLNRISDDSFSKLGTFEYGHVVIQHHGESGIQVLNLDIQRLRREVGTESSVVIGRWQLAGMEIDFSGTLYTLTAGYEQVFPCLFNTQYDFHANGTYDVKHLGTTVIGETKSFGFSDSYGAVSLASFGICLNLYPDAYPEAAADKQLIDKLAGEGTFEWYAESQSVIHTKRGFTLQHLLGVPYGQIELPLSYETGLGPWREANFYEVDVEVIDAATLRVGHTDRVVGVNCYSVFLTRL
jgi:hypothetical protein